MPKIEPVRWFAIVAALLALVAHYVPDLPTALFLGLVGAILGVGSEVARAAVTPIAKFRSGGISRRRTG